MSWTTIYEALPSGVGVRSTDWFAIPGDPTLWQIIFCKKETYQPRLSLLAHETTDEMAKMLGLQYVEANPSTKVISTGIRHISGAKPFIAGCRSWVSKSGQVSAWKTNPAGFGLSDLALVEETTRYRAAQLKADLQQGEFWYAGAKVETDETLQLEHYFECRFAGPLIAAITDNYTKTDASTQEAIVLLDRIVNNVSNLTWAPESLNSYKNNYFGGVSFKQDKFYAAFAEYMDQKMFEFMGLIIKIASRCFPKDKPPVYPPTSTMARMLKLLWDSPFCQGRWITLPANSGNVCWNDYGAHPMKMKMTADGPVWVYN